MKNIEGIRLIGVAELAKECGLTPKESKPNNNIYDLFKPKKGTRPRIKVKPIASSKTN